MKTIDPPKQYASESGRFYTRDGEPLNLVPNKSKPGEFRKATLADCRKAGALPSVTTILGIIAKPGLDTWKVDQYLNAAFEMPPIGAESREDWISAVRNRAAGQMDICRDLGTEVHGAINRHFKREDSEERFDPFIEAAVNSLKEIGVWDKQNDQDLESEKTFASIDYGFGGCIDGCLSHDIYLWDFKCIDRLDKKWDYDERLAQISAYIVGRYGTLSLEYAKGYNIAISTNEPGKYAIREWSPEELVRGWDIFSAANKLWRALNQYEP